MMISEHQNRLLTRVVGDAPMGRLMRRYWAPVLQSERVEADGAPVKLRILGENLIAFRGSDGTVCIVDERCPHRGASLALGRNEDCGLRCILHGWKIGTNGQVIEAANMPAGARLDAIPTGHRPTYESGGVVWAWFGAGAPVPEKPCYPHVDLPEGHVGTVLTTVDCNWLQLLETLWDPYHISWLHRDSIQSGFEPNEDETFHSTGIPAMRMHRTSYGWFRHSRDPEGIEVKVPYVPPYFSHHSMGNDEGHDSIAIGHVPVDDRTTLLWGIVFNRTKPLAEGRWGQTFLDSFPTRYNFRIEHKPENNWLQDREAMKAGRSFSGIGFGTGAMAVLVEDSALLESVGPIADRTHEHLAPTDVLMARARSYLLELMDREANGEVLPGTGEEVRDTEPQIRKILVQDIDWLSSLEDPQPAPA